MTSTPIVVNEMFGPTIQGEGPLTGRRCGFVRLGRCDLDCDWCDTPHSWDWTRHDPKIELTTTTVDDVITQLAHRVTPNTGGIVITGGEPLLQRQAVTELANRALNGWQWCQIETNGRHQPPDDLNPQVRIVTSPKLSNSGVDRDLAIRPDTLEALNEWGAHFKFVARAPDCLDEIDDLVTHIGVGPGRVWVMPEGGTNVVFTQHLTRLADQIIDRGWNLSPRLHVTLWGQERQR